MVLLVVLQSFTITPSLLQTTGMAFLFVCGTCSKVFGYLGSFLTVFSVSSYQEDPGKPPSGMSRLSPKEVCAAMRANKITAVELTASRYSLTYPLLLQMAIRGAKQRSSG